MTMNAAIRLCGVVKTFRSGEAGRPHVAVDSLSLTVPTGAVFGLLGPNGSGKTTTIRMIMGILLPDEGSVAVLGSRPEEVVRSRVGYLPEERGLYPKMGILEHLTFLARLHGLGRARSRERALEALAEFGNVMWAERKVEELSKGQQQTIQLAAALIHNPELVILDEPFTGLDPVNADRMRSTIRGLRSSGKTVVLSTHRMEQVEMLCDEICLISEGAPVVAGKLSDVRAAHRRNTVRVVFEDPELSLDTDDVVAAAERKQDGWHVVLREEADSQTLLRRCADRGRLIRFEMEEPTLDEVFVQVVTKP